MTGIHLTSVARPEITPGILPFAPSGPPSAFNFDPVKIVELYRSNLSGKGRLKKKPPKGGFLTNVARPERFELPTFWFVARHSIQLSYGRVVFIVSRSGLSIPDLRQRIILLGVDLVNRASVDAGALTP